MDWIESFLQNYGIWAMFVLIMLEYVCFPVSSEIILPLAGVMAAGQGLFFPYLVLFATGAGLIGTLIPYGIGRFGGSPLLERIMKRFSSMEKPILTSYRVFGNHEKSAVLISRVIPLCRTISALSRVPWGRISAVIFCILPSALLHGTRY